MSLLAGLKQFHLRKDRALVVPTLVCLVLVPALLITMALGTRRSFKDAQQLNAEVLHSYEERLQMLVLLSTVQEVETDQRMYSQTGEERLVPVYRSGVAQLAAQRRRLSAIQDADGDGSRGLEHRERAELDRLIDAKLEYMETAIALRRRDPEQAAALAATGRGKQLIDAIQARLQQMSAREATALSAQIANYNASSRLTEQKALLSFLALCLLLFGAMALILRQTLSRQKLLDQAKADAARLSAIFDSAHDGLVTFNRSGTIQSINAAGQRMYGYTADELQRRDASMLLDFPDRDSLFLAKLIGENPSSGGLIREFIARRKDGATFPAEVSIGRFILADGEHVVAAIRDISERRRADRLKSEFVSTVSHELRTPLTSIAGSLGLLVGGAAGVMEARAQRLIGIAHANCQRLVRLINDILDIEKIESGQMTFVMAPLNLGDLVRTTVEAMQGLANQLGVAFEIQTKADTPMVRADADRMSQVITNLLSNAAKVSPQGSTVRVTIEPVANQRVRMSVKDQGSGVPEDFRDRIFSKFAQADGSDTRRMGGTGLGLAISREIVDRHDGRIWFDSPPGEGATFCVELPAYAPTRNLPIVAAGKVLICEDDPDAAAILAEMVQGLGRASVIVGSIAQAEATLKASPNFAAMLLDLRLPDGHGLDLLGRIRSNPATRGLPVLIISGEPPQALDVIDWLQKPVDPARLKLAVDSLHSGSTGLRPQILHVEDDPDLRQLVAEILAPHFDILAADTVASARELLREARPQLAILDIALPDGSGLELMPDIRRLQNRVPVIVFSAQSPDEQDLPATIDAVLTKSRASLENLADMVSRLIPRPDTEEQS